jgi:hypothetical protein
MSELAFVQRRLRIGDKIAFCQGYYGDQWIELRRWWLLWPKTRVRLTAQEISDLKTAIERTRQRK